jgi:hypothetical protein
LYNNGFFDNPEIIALARKQDNQNLRLKFREAYTEELKKIGYQFCDYKPVKHYYELIFASCHKKGIEFWKKANSISFTGQRELPL